MGSLKEFLDANKAQGIIPEFIFHELKTLTLALDAGSNPSSRTILRVALLLALAGKEKRQQMGFDLFFKDQTETHPR